MATKVMSFLKKATPKTRDKDKGSDKDKRKNDKARERTFSPSSGVPRSAYISSVAPTVPPKPPSDDPPVPPHAPAWVDRTPPLVLSAAPPLFADLRQTTADPSARDKVGPWVQSHGHIDYDPIEPHGHPYDDPLPGGVISRMHSPATVHPQESVSVIGVGRGVPRTTGHRTMQSFGAFGSLLHDVRSRNDDESLSRRRPRSEAMSRGVTREEPLQEKSKPPSIPKPLPRSIVPPPLNSPIHVVFPTTPKPPLYHLMPHLHQPRPEFPFDYAEAQEERDRQHKRQEELEARNREAENHQRLCDIMAEREAAHQAAEVAESDFNRQREHVAERELQRESDDMAERELAHQREREGNGAFNAAFARLYGSQATYLRAAQDLQNARQNAIADLNAPDMDRRHTQDTFSSESFGHKFHADGKPIPPPSGTNITAAHTRAATPGSRSPSPFITRASELDGIKGDLEARVKTVAAHKAHKSPKRKGKKEYHHKEHHHRTPSNLLETMAITRNLTVVRSVDESDFIEDDESDADAVTQITRITAIAKLVDNSTFHDDTLCQLLDAARLNLIGEQAKRALMRAARTRVNELSRQILERDSSRGSTPPLIIRKRVKKGNKSKLTSASELPAEGVGLNPALSAAPAPAPTTPCQSPSPLPGMAAAPESDYKKFEEVSPIPDQLAEITARMSTLVELMEANLKRPDLDGVITNSGFPLSAMGSFPGSQQFQKPQIPPQQQFPPQQFQQPQRFEEPQQFSPQEWQQQQQQQFQPPDAYQPSPEVEQQFQHFQTSSPMAGGYIPTGGLADEYMMGGGSVHTPPNVAPERSMSPRTVPQAPPSPAPSAQEAPSAKAPSAKAPSTKAPSAKSATPKPTSKPLSAMGARTPDQAASEAHGSPSSVRTPTGPIINVFSPTTINGKPTHSHASKGNKTPTAPPAPSTPTQRTATIVTSAGPRSSAPAPAATPAQSTAQVRRSAPPDSTRSAGTATPIKVILERDLSSLAEKVASYLVQSPAAPMPASPVPASRGASPVVQAPSKIVTTWSNSTHGKSLESVKPSTEYTKIVVRDNLSPTHEQSRPWDAVVHRLHSMATVWEEESFVRALKIISLDGELDLVPLTIYALTIFKTHLRNRLTASKPLVCDKLMVSAVHAETINSYIVAKKYIDAAQILLGLWAPLSKEPPRVIISMTKHGYQEGWLAHRFALSNGHLTTHHCVHQESRVEPFDSRPFNWWHAIRLAWPERKFPDPRDLLQRNVKHVYTATPNDNSLRAALVTRNLLNGNKGDVDHGLGKLRQVVWEMTQHLYAKKRAGKLVIADD